MKKYYIPILILTLVFSACKKETDDGNGDSAPSPMGVNGEGVTDVDGNKYQTVVISGQEWMAENLKTAHFANGDTIISGRKIGDISNQGSPMFFFYPNGDSNNVNRYGRLYTYFVVEDPRNVCPTGWRVPSKADFDTLVKNAGGYAYSGGHLKSTSYWAAPNTGGDNQSLFGALPAGYRLPDNQYPEVTKFGGFWTNTLDTANRVWTYYAKYNFSYTFQSPTEKKEAYSVRCIKN